MKTYFLIIIASQTGMWSQFVENTYTIMPKSLDDFLLWGVCLLAVVIFIATLYTLMNVYEALQTLVKRKLHDSLK